MSQDAAKHISVDSAVVVAVLLKLSGIIVLKEKRKKKKFSVSSLLVGYVK